MSLLKERIAKRGLPPELAAQLERRVDLKPFKVTKEGATEEKGASFFAVLIFTVILYSTFLMYGMQNMKGVIDEKTNRIVEVVIASVRPTELMLGKIVGIGLVGLTQYLDLVPRGDEPVAPRDRGHDGRRPTWECRRSRCP